MTKFGALAAGVYVVLAFAVPSSVKADDSAAGVAKWSGLYMGLNAGHAWSGADVNFSPSLSTWGYPQPPISDNSFSHDMDGYVLGGHVGYQRQFGRWVLGVEGTFDAADLEGSSKSNSRVGCPPFACDIVSSQERFTTKVDNIITVTGRVGYTFSSLLVYVKGGYASAEVAYAGAVHVETSDPGDPSTVYGIFEGSGGSEKRHNGWTIGGGVEYMIRPNVTLGMDYSYIGLESAAHNGFPVGGQGLTIAGTGPVKVGPDAIHTVTARLTFLLNGP